MCGTDPIFGEGFKEGGVQWLPWQLQAPPPHLRGPGGLSQELSRGMENGLDADQEPWPLSLACFDLRSISLDLSSLRMSGLDVETCKTHGSNYKGSEEHEEEGQFLCYHCPTHSD